MAKYIRSAEALARFYRELLDEGVRPPLADRLVEVATSALVARTGLVVSND